MGMKTFVEWVGDGLVDVMASRLHDDWRKGRLKSGTHGSSDAVYEPRLKPSGLDDGKDIDIAQAYHKLTPKWQSENRSAAKAALDIVRRELASGLNLDSLVKAPNLERLASSVHDEWMERNPKAEYNADQHVSYSLLPEQEKQKDRDHVLIAIDLIRGSLGA